MSKDKEDDIEKRLKELDPSYGDVKAALPSLSASAPGAPGGRSSVQFSDNDQIFLNLLGGYAGSKLAGKAQANYEKLLRDRMESMGSRPAGPVGGLAGPTPAGPAAPGPVAAGAIPSQAPPAGPGVSAATLYPEATGPGSATFNYGRKFNLPEIEAAKALGTGKLEGEVWDLLEKRRQALTNIQQRFPTESYVENPRYGGIMTPDQGAGRGPRASFATATPEPGQTPPPGGMRPLPPRAPVLTTPPPPGALDRVLGGAKSVGRAGMELASAPRVAGALGGMGVAEAGQQVYGRYANDPVGATIAGAGGMLGAAAMLPGVPLPVRLGLGAVSPLSLYLYDKFKPYRSVLEQPQQ